MEKSNKQDFDMDDFPMSPVGSESAQKYYESFLRSSEIFDQIPQKQRLEARAFLRVFKEVHAQIPERRVLFRKNVDAKDALTALWFSKIEDLAKLFVSFNELPEFQGICSSQMADLAKLSTDVESITRLPMILAEKGIVLIYEPYIPGMKLDGVVFSLESGHPVIALSLRFPRLDSLWFTLMHELAHIALHYDRLSAPIMDDLEEQSEDLVEKEADRLALNATVSRSDWRNCEAKYDLSEKAVNSFAQRVGVHPAIVAGRLRKELNRYNIFSDIVNSVDVRKVIWK